MLFNSLTFIVGFLPIVLAGYLLLGWLNARRAAIGWLVVTSLFFYGWWSPKHLPLLVASILVNFVLGRALARTRSGKRALLALGCAFNLGLLGYFKYSGLFVDSVNGLAGTDWEWTRLILPIGISFYTFQQIAYLVDVSRGEHPRIPLLDYCLFVTFFPQLIAGPIVHPREMLPQFSSGSAFTRVARNLAIGLSIFALGLGKKVIVADHLAAFVDPIFATVGAGGACTSAEAWLATLGYSFQLYFDFSGYSDMAIGLGLMFGIRLPVNFLSPYRARSIIDFWRRWHVTLSRFLRDYLYIPLGGSQRGLSRRYVNLFITMGLGGLWHGAGWNFLIWGLLHGLYLSVNHAWNALTDRSAALQRLGQTRLWAPVAWTLTFLAVAVGWVFFRSPDLGSATQLLGALVGLQGWSLPLPFQFLLGPLAENLAQLGVVFAREPVLPLREWVSFLPMLMLAGVMAVALPNIPEIFRLADQVRAPVPAVRGVLHWRPTRAWALATTAVFCASVFLLERPSVFLYFQF